MMTSDENSANIREFLAYRNPSSAVAYSLGSNNCDLDDTLLETVELMGNSREFFLQRRTLLMNE